MRQSWLNDVVLCPERARLGIVSKHMRSSTDSTIMGTAVHSAIEDVLNNKVELADMGDVAMTAFTGLQKTEPYRETNIDPDKYETFILSMCESFKADILPNVSLGGHTEMKFEYPLGFTVMGHAIWCEGTMDYVDTNGVVWDWKTANRKYNQREKQSTSIQSTVYAGAVVHMGMTDFPVEFNYGVMIRQAKPVGQIVPVHRNKNHMNWLRSAVEPAVTTALLVGMDNKWMINDTNNLCSERWCSFWSICKGAYLSSPDLFPQEVEIKITEKDTVDKV